jgi:hypothetical protein
MASTATGYGFRPSSNTSTRITPRKYTIASGYAANIFSGEPVKLLTDGTIALATSDGTRTGNTLTVKLLGVFAGCRYVDSLGKPQVSSFWPTGTSATNIEAYVYDDPNQEFETIWKSTDTVNVISPIANIGEQFSWQPSLSGSTATGQSYSRLTDTAQANSIETVVVSGNTIDVITGSMFTLIDTSGFVSDNPYDEYFNVKVKPNNHVYKRPSQSI